MTEQDLKEFNQNILNKIDKINKNYEYVMGNGIHIFKKEISEIAPDFRNIKNFNNNKFTNECIKLKLMPLHISNDIVYNTLPSTLSINNTTISNSINNITQDVSVAIAKNIKNEFTINFGTTTSKFINELPDFDNWYDLYKTNKNNFYFYMRLLLLSVSSIKLFISYKNIDNDIKKHKNTNVLFHTSFDVSNEQFHKNIIQQLLCQQHKHDIELQGNTLYTYILTPKNRKSFDLDCFNLKTSTNNDIRWFDTLFHQNTMNFLKERKHDIIFNRIFTLLNSFFWWQQIFIKPTDRYRYLLAGSTIKASLGLRDSKDVDFIILDHDNNIEKYNSLKPNIGINGIFDDFGKTYYSNELFYNPIIPSLYEKQKNNKINIKKTDTITIENNFPLFSVSGLKIARYFPVFRYLANKINNNFQSYDDLVINPEFYINFLGCRIIDIKYEFIRDIIKGIDLSFVSKKQMHDFDLFFKLYPSFLSQDEINTIGIHKFVTQNVKDYKKTSIKINNKFLYHNDQDKIDKTLTDIGAFDVIVRHAPLYINNIIKSFIINGPLINIKQNYDKPILDEYYNNVLLSSLPNGKYYFECTYDGIFNIYINDTSISNITIFRGKLLVENINQNTTFKYNITNDKHNEFKNLTNKYKSILIRFINICVQIHKIVDCHIKYKINTEHTTNPF